MKRSFWEMADGRVVHYEVLKTVSIPGFKFPKKLSRAEKVKVQK